MNKDIISRYHRFCCSYDDVWNLIRDYINPRIQQCYGDNSNVVVLTGISDIYELLKTSRDDMLSHGKLLYGENIIKSIIIADKASFSYTNRGRKIFHWIDYSIIIMTRDVSKRKLTDYEIYKVMSLPPNDPEYLSNIDGDFQLQPSIGNNEDDKVVMPIKALGLSIPIFSLIYMQRIDMLIKCLIMT